jgi:cytochrome oxidase Cu insertion factor (SCO1/SenC/PrrC family)
VKQTLLALVLLLASSFLSAQSEFDRPDPMDDNMKTGIAVGEKIPFFEAVDQNGRKWSFDDLKGPEGAFILFYRSADW